MAELNAKHKRFVAEYLIDRNATNAAIRAGYSKKTARQIGSKLLTNIDIQTLVNKREEIIQEKLGIDQEWVRRRLKLISDVNSEMIDVPFGSGDSAIINKKMRDAAAANKSTELLGKDVGMFTEKIELTGKDGKDLLERTPEQELELARSLAALLSNPKLLKK